MAKEITVKIVDESKLKFELLEDGKIGDYFILNNDQNTQTTQAITKFLEKENSNLIANKVLESQTKWEHSFKSRVSEVEQKKELEIDKKWSEKHNQLKQKIQQLENDKQTAEGQYENKFLKKLNSKIEEFTKHIQSLEQENTALKTQLSEKLQNFENEKKSIEKNTVLTVQASWQEKISSLIQDKNILETKLQMELQNFENKKEAIEKNAILNAKLSWNEEKAKLEKEIEDLYRNRGINSKNIGEDLENWISSEFDNAMGLLGDSKLEKINVAINGKKADFLFTVVYQENEQEPNILTNIVIEAKSQGISGKNKNEDFYAALDKNRKNQKAEYALLITELEPDKEFLIKKVNQPEYENMYVIRPAYFVSFLSLIRLLSLKRKSVINEQINFKKKNEILEKLEELKNEILDNSVKNITQKITESKGHCDKINESVEKIRKSMTLILDTHIKTLSNKIKNFDVKVQTLNKEIVKIQQKED